MLSYVLLLLLEKHIYRMCEPPPPPLYIDKQIIIIQFDEKMVIKR